MNKSLAVKTINAGEDFKSFWQRAKGEPFEAQARLWDEQVEAKYQKGLEVVRQLAVANEIGLMAKWGLDEIHANVEKALAALEARQTAG